MKAETALSQLEEAWRYTGLGRLGVGGDCVHFSLCVRNKSDFAFSETSYVAFTKDLWGSL